MELSRGKGKRCMGGGIGSRGRTVLGTERGVFERGGAGVLERGGGACLRHAEEQYQQEASEQPHAAAGGDEAGGDGVEDGGQHTTAPAEPSRRRRRHTRGAAGDDGERARRLHDEPGRIPQPHAVVVALQIEGGRGECGEHEGVRRHVAVDGRVDAEGRGQQEHSREHGNNEVLSVPRLLRC